MPLEPPADSSSVYARSCRTFPAERIRRLGEPVDSIAALVLVTSGRDRLFEQVAAGAMVGASNVINQFVGDGRRPRRGQRGGAREADRGAGRIPRKAFNEAIAAAASPGSRRSATSRRRQMSEAAALEPLIDAVLAANPAQVEQYRAGRKDSSASSSAR